MKCLDEIELNNLEIKILKIMKEIHYDYIYRDYYGHLMVGNSETKESGSLKPFEMLFQFIDRKDKYAVLDLLAKPSKNDDPVEIMMNQSIIKESVNWYVPIPQQIICCEELAELTQVVTKLLRYKTQKGYIPNQYDLLDHLIEEMADVYIVLENLKLIHGVSSEEINDMIAYKQYRNSERMRESQKLLDADDFINWG